MDIDHAASKGIDAHDEYGSDRAHADVADHVRVTLRGADAPRGDVRAVVSRAMDLARRQPAGPLPPSHVHLSLAVDQQRGADRRASAGGIVAHWISRADARRGDDVCTPRHPTTDCCLLLDCRSVDGVDGRMVCADRDRADR